MRISRKQGSTLVVAAGLMTILLGWVAIVYSISTSTAKNTKRSTDYAALRVAATGAVEYAYASWRASVRNNHDIPTVATISTFNLSAYTPPAGMEIAPGGDLTLVPLDTDGNPISSGKPASAKIGLTGYQGWTGYNYQYMASVQLRYVNRPDITAGVRRKFQCNMVSLFQTIYFYEDTLEFYRPAPMIIGGLVHTNGSLNASWSDGMELTFRDGVSWADKDQLNHDNHIYLGGDNITAGMQNWNPNTAGPGTIHDPTFPNGESNQVTSVSRMEPLGKDIGDVMNTTDSNPNNDGLHELIELPDTSDPANGDVDAIAKMRFSNKAGIVVKVSPTGSLTFTGQNGVSATLPSANQTAITSAKVSQKTLYDFRESNDVNVVTFDTKALSTALTGVPGFNGVVYFDLSETATAPRRAIRLINGELSNPLTIVSSDGVYIQGDYNARKTTETSTSIPANNGNLNNDQLNHSPTYTVQPAAVIGDAVMVLSNNFNDSWMQNAGARTVNSDSMGWNNQNTMVATNTTINTAIMGGIVKTGTTFSGGGPNFIRFEENWSNVYCTYYGSMVELFGSKSFTGKWKRGAVYVPPNRRWNFDTGFTENPPPGTLDPLLISRGPFESI